MFKVEVIKPFTLAKYDEIKDTLERKTRDQGGYLFEGDIFKCDQEMVDYLLGQNKMHQAFVKVIELIPDKLIKKEEEPEKKAEKKITTKKSTTAKKSIAKK